MAHYFNIITIKYAFYSFSNASHTIVFCWFLSSYMHAAHELSIFSCMGNSQLISTKISANATRPTERPNHRKKHELKFGQPTASIDKSI